MQIEDKNRVAHIIEAAQEAQLFLADKSLDDLKTDRLLAFAVVRALEIIGEAAAQTSQEFRDSFSFIKWRDIISMRNKLIHAYFDINYAVVWAAVKKDIPELLSQLQKIVDEK